MRRLHVPFLSVGKVTLDATQSHHARAVLRIDVGDVVEAFDANGQSGAATVERTEPAVVLKVDALTRSADRPSLTIASAVPKGDRADWLAEKLSEIGVCRWIPLRTARSVVHPEGEKTKRWERIAIEAAKQSRRTGVMSIDRLTALPTLLNGLNATTTFVLSTRSGSKPLSEAIETITPSLLLIGPEGGWEETEEADMIASGLTAVTLGPTILRIETAAVLAAGLVQLLTRSKPA